VKTVSTLYVNKFNEILTTFTNGTTKETKITPEGLKTVITKNKKGDYIVTQNPDGSISYQTINENDT
jgi:hypothetical protein